MNICRSLHRFGFCLFLIFFLSTTYCSSNHHHRQHQRLSANKMAKLREHLLATNSLQQFTKNVDKYCSAQQERMITFYVKSANISDQNGCECADGRCSCCAVIDVHFHFVRLDKEVCLNITYLAESKSINLLVQIDHRVVFNITISATNPPPVCIPFLVGELCFEFYNLKIEGHWFSGCLLLELFLLHQEVIHEKLGCFKMPFADDQLALKMD